ncbi:MAG TPA: DNA-directed RNA polymerase subunit omega [Deltaproteobacteria bacterium]|nr:DNA-directed RNA polymerase subunit omega [Deltaproteobacteria bacterium]
MARITVEDCMEHIPNRFQLVRMASIRAKQLKKGARPLLKVEENKQVVMSLREIAAGLVKPGDAPPAETASAPAGVDAPGATDAASTPDPSGSVPAPTEPGPDSAS